MSIFKPFGGPNSRATTLSAEIGAGLFEKSADAIIVTASSGKCLDANEAACVMFAYRRDEFMRLSFTDLFPPTTDPTQFIGSAELNLKDKKAGDTVVIRKDGKTVPVDVAVHTLRDGKYLSIFRDIRKRKEDEGEFNQLLRVYETLSRVNHAILRTNDRDSLFQDVCEVAVRFGGFGLASIGLVDQSGETIRLTSWKGAGKVEPPYETIAINRPPEEGGLVARAAKSGALVTSDDLQTDANSAFWAEQAVKRNLHSAAAVPLKVEGVVVGVLTLVLNERESFAEREMELLDSMGENISFALEAMKHETDREAAEAALKESEERYRSAFENTTIGLYRTAPDGRILMANRALIEMLGYSSLEELRSRDLKKAGFEPDYPREEFTKKVKTGGQVIGLETAWRGSDGRVTYVRESARAVRNSEGKMLYYEGAIEDITERKIAEETIREKNMLLDEMSKMAKIGAWEFNTENMRGSWTEETARIHGLDPSAETDVRTGISFYKDEDRKRIEAAIKRAIDTGQPYDLELEMTAADGSHKWVRTIAHPVKEDGRIVKIRGTFQDITESKRAKDRIWYLTRLYATLSQVNQTIVRTKEPVELYRLICDVALQFGEFPLVAVGLYDKENHCVDLVQWKSSRIPDQPYTSVDIRLPQYKDGLLSTSISNNKVVTSADVPAMVETKHWRDVLLKHGLNVAAAVPFRVKGEVVGVLTLYAYEKDIFMPEVIGLLEEMALDISFALDSIETDRERRRDEKALTEERDRIAMVAKTAPGLIHSYRIKTDGTPCMPYASPAIKDVYGFSLDQVADDLSPVFVRINPEDLDRVNRTISESARTMKMWHDEFRYDHPVKGEVWIEGRSMPVREADGSVTWHGFIQDITERKRNEKALRESEKRFRSIMDQMTDTVFVSSSEGIIIYMSPSCGRLFGFRAEEMTGKHFTVFLRDDDVALAMKTFEKAHRTAQPTKNLELRMKKKDGTFFYGELDASLYNNGDISGSMGVIRDITQRKNAERELRQAEAKRRELERQLIQAQKLESLGTLAGGIAHDFNNLLGVIMGYSALLKEEDLDSASIKSSIESIEKASERGAALVKQLLTFARKTETIFNPVPINEIILDTISFLKETFPKTITIETNLGKGVQKVVGDSTQLHQVVMNLCINARDAMPKGGRMRIATARADSDQVIAKFPPGSDPNREYVVVTVSDTGIGMDEATKRKIFDPFFTTKGPGKGTGLGLAVVYSILQGHGGFVSLESEPGKGARFDVYLPSVLTETEARDTAAEPSGDYPGGFETVLVIEDEQMLLAMLRDTLVPRGYSVLTARDGEEGVDIFARHLNDIHAVITDLGLPKIGGEEVLQRIKSIRPDAKVIVASGFIDPNIRSQLMAEGARFFIQKPFVPIQILRMLRKVLDS